MTERTPFPTRDEIYPDLAVAVLAGGKSSRFGADKALVRFDPNGPTLLERTVATAHSLSEMVAVVGHERYTRLDLGVPILQDDDPGRGPLGGIATAMGQLDRPRLLVLACDMPCLSLPLLRWMIERPEIADVLIPRTDDGQWQPLHALYRSAALPVIEQCLSSGSGAIRSILPLLAVETISEAALRTIDPELNSLFSLNRIQDLDRARRCVAGRGFDTK
jgi:molybdopterin-guanine dinucleotide biosynthesis protein A